MLATESRLLQRSTRRLAVRAAVADWFRQRSWSRWTMGLSVTLCGMFAWGISSALLTLGVSPLWVRYPLALCSAYVAFLGLLGWLITRSASRLQAEQDSLRKDSVRQQLRSQEGNQLGLGKLLDSLGDVAEQSRRQIEPQLLPVWATVGLAATIVLVLLYYIWAAPLLMSEVLVEGGLAPWIYRPISRGPLSTWRDVALELTGPAATVMVFCALGIAIAMSWFAPQATDIVDVWDRVVAFRELAIRQAGGQ